MTVKTDEQVLKDQLTRYYADLDHAGKQLEDVRKELRAFQHTSHSTRTSAYHSLAFQVMWERFKLAERHQKEIERRITNAMAKYETLAEIFGSESDSAI